MCPKCFSEGPLTINVSAFALMHDDGSEDVSGIEWSDESSCHCDSCKYLGRVVDFNVKARKYRHDFDLMFSIVSDTEDPDNIPEVDLLLACRNRLNGLAPGEIREAFGHIETNGEGE